MGSVKDIEIIEKAEGNRMGIGRFHFSDRYSVFDWGQMPDLIEGKGVSLCIVGAYFFEKLAEKGIKTHYRGLIDEKGELKRKKVKIEHLTAAFYRRFIMSQLVHIVDI